MTKRKEASYQRLKSAMLEAYFLPKSNQLSEHIVTLGDTQDLFPRTVSKLIRSATRLATHSQRYLAPYLNHAFVFQAPPCLAVRL
jgi:hypothetical protein